MSQNLFPQYIENFELGYVVLGKVFTSFVFFGCNAELEIKSAFDILIENECGNNLLYSGKDEKYENGILYVDQIITKKIINIILNTDVFEIIFTGNVNVKFYFDSEKSDGLEILYRDLKSKKIMNYFNASNIFISGTHPSSD